MTIDWGTIKVDKEGDEKILEDILPPNYDYKVRLFMIEERSKTNNLTETKFKAKVDTNVCNEPALGEWILEYESITNTSHNQSHSDYRGKDGVVLGGFRKCQHNVSQSALAVSHKVYLGCGNRRMQCRRACRASRPRNVGRNES